MKYILISLAGAAFLYLLIAFTKANINFMNWNEETRAFYSIYVIFFMLLFVIGYNIYKLIDNKS